MKNIPRQLEEWVIKAHPDSPLAAEAKSRPARRDAAPTGLVETMTAGCKGKPAASGTVVSTTEGAMRTMMIAKLKVVVAVAVMALAAGASASAQAGEPRIVFQEDFESGKLLRSEGGKWTYYGETGKRQLSRLVVDPDEALRGKGAMKTFWYPGTATGGSPRFSFPPLAETFYVRWYHKLSPRFVWGNHNKMFYVFGKGKVYFKLQPSFYGGGIPHLWGRGTKAMAPNKAPGFRLPRNRWFCVEILLTMNTVGERDGTAKMWIDGKLVSDWPDERYSWGKIQLRTSADACFDRCWMDNYFNMLPTRYMPADLRRLIQPPEVEKMELECVDHMMYAWRDEIVVADRRIGPLKPEEIEPDETPPVAEANPPGGVLKEPRLVSLSSNKRGCTFFYTTDGSEPEVTDIQSYSGPIWISRTTTLKFLALDRAGRPGPVRTARYHVVGATPVIFSDNFESGRLYHKDGGLWFGMGNPEGLGGKATTWPKIVSGDGPKGAQGRRIVEFECRKGQYGSGLLETPTLVGRNELYVGWWQKFSPDWQWPRTATILLRIYLNDDRSISLIVTREGKPRVVACLGRDKYRLLSVADEAFGFGKGRWHRIVARCRLDGVEGTPGLFQLLVDGKSVVDEKNFAMPAGYMTGRKYLNRVTFTCYVLGTGTVNATPEIPKDMKCWIDDVIVSTAPPPKHPAAARP